MKRNIRGELSIFVIAILALSLAMPLVSVLAIGLPTVDPVAGPYYVGDTLTISGTAGEVTSGSAVSIYWDIASGPDAWLLNTTTGNPDGSYDVMIDIPDTTTGDHYVWVKDVATSDTNGDLSITVSPEVDTDISSGLPGDELEVTGTGFGDEQPVNVTFYNSTGIIFNENVVPFSDDIETDEWGTFVVTFDIPDDLSYGTYFIDGHDNTSTTVVSFIVGAAITLTPEEGPTGTVATIEGRGWTDAATMTFAIGATTVEVVDGDTITVASDGEFTADIVIPNMGNVDEYSITASESGPIADASEDFDITGIPEIEVSPTYGSPGATITVTGSNFTQIADTEVVIELWVKGTTNWVADLVIAETDSDGKFEDTFVSPAVTFTSYDVGAVDSMYGLDAIDAFKVGLIALIVNPTSGESGTMMAITGIGFTDGDYNLTFGDDLNEAYGTVNAEAISDIFYVPNVEPGTYSILVSDIDDNELTQMFTVTESTYVDMDPTVAPNEYNISFSGHNFAEAVGPVDFVIYNATDDWAMNVVTDPGQVSVATDDDGNFTAYWIVLDEDTLSLGDYTINVTDSEDLMVQLSFSIVAARVDVAPRKALFDRGDAISFDISNDFDLPDSYIEIFGPDDTLYWITELFDAGMWVLVGDLYTVPYYRQLANANPMEIASDAPMGTWTYFFYDVDDEELMNGTIEVGPSTAAQVDALLEDVRTDLSGLSDDVADLGGDFDALSDEIEGVSDDMDTLRDEIVSDLAGDIADATAAANEAGDAVDDLEGALDDLGDSVGDIADTANDALDAASAAADAADTAASSAEDASTAASGLTTLVYGAIGASLIAALAAIVSLMQISRRIAG